jgi:hypothetical protein
MKKTTIALCALISLSAEAQLPQTFTQVLQSFAQSNKLTYVPEAPNQGNYVTYKFFK